MVVIHFKLSEIYSLQNSLSLSFSLSHFIIRSYLFVSPLINTITSFNNSFMVLEPRSMASTTPTDATQSIHTTPTQPTTIPSTSVPSTSTLPTGIQSPLLFLSNMSNLMSIKLDYTNYIPWRHQLLTILEAYSLIEHIDGTTLKPSPFTLDTTRNVTLVANLEFQAWKIKDKALLSLINSTLSP